MTHKDYAEIQRNLGYIEGLIADCNTVVFDGVQSAVDKIDSLISEEFNQPEEKELIPPDDWNG